MQGGGHNMSIFSEIKSKINCADVLRRFNVTYDGNAIRCPLPGHDDGSPSFSTYEADSRFKCFGCGKGGDSIELYELLSGKNQGETIIEMKEIAGITDATPEQKDKPVISKIYDYCNADGSLNFQVCRFIPKTFKQRKNADVWKMDGVQKTLYKLPELIAANKTKLIFLCEGEKDVETLFENGFLATCNAGGAVSSPDDKKWLPSYTETLTGCNLCIVADKDEPGRKHAAAVAEIMQGRATAIRVIECPDVNGQKVKDASDYFQAGGTVEELKEIVRTATIVQKMEPTVEDASPLPEPVEKYPYRNITPVDVLHAIEGTALGQIAAYLSFVCDPVVPIQISLMKAIALMGCALSEKDGLTDATDKRGVELARVKINTAGGQALNFYGLVVIPSGCGKDVGNIEKKIGFNRRWLIGNGGSAEGLLDAFVEKPNGLLVISELMNYLDKRSWQSKAASTLTEIFSLGWFDVRMSASDKKKPRKADYCFPNILGYIQPGVFHDKVSCSDITSGFLGRFLISEADIPFKIVNPRSIDTNMVCRDIEMHLKKCTYKRGDIAVPENYMSELRDYFNNNEIHPNLRPTASRLVNEYGPRLAALLSIPIHDDGSEQIIITDEAWRRASVLVQWFFANAERCLRLVNDDNDVIKRRVKIQDRILHLIKTSKDQGIIKADISRNTGMNSGSKERSEALLELLELGQINMEGGKYFHVR
jgi:hypothetical protein